MVNWSISISNQKMTEWSRPAILITAPLNNTRTLKFNAQHAIWFYAAINHYRNSHLKAETNRMDRNPPITTQEHDLLNSVKQCTCFLRGPWYN